MERAKGRSCGRVLCPAKGQSQRRREGEGRSRTRRARSSSVLPTSGSARSSYSAGDLVPVLSSELASASCFSATARSLFSSAIVRKKILKATLLRGATKRPREAAGGGIYRLGEQPPRAFAQTFVRKRQSDTCIPCQRFTGISFIVHRDPVGMVGRIMVRPSVASIAHPKRTGRTAQTRPSVALLNAVQRCECILTLLNSSPLALSKVTDTTSEPLQIASDALYESSSTPFVSTCDHDLEHRAKAFLQASQVLEQTGRRPKNGWALSLRPQKKATQALGRAP
ncbi:hypothetical protein CC80DRAFT_281821 [Byssothecium circinans]|uniref:Uncharacterized protein n=1 Tax=Byssothecium circinans TaxID=147558 RepID=A0A6A5TBC7_9PLEO|nr:hypothetical protein CC80DRAFT_281821 [Byssothecium circinans]